MSNEIRSNLCHVSLYDWSNFCRCISKKFTVYRFTVSDIIDMTVLIFQQVDRNIICTFITYSNTIIYYNTALSTSTFLQAIVLVPIIIDISKFIYKIWYRTMLWSKMVKNFVSLPEPINCDKWRVTVDHKTLHQKIWWISCDQLSKLRYICFGRPTQVTFLILRQNTSSSH